MRASFESHWTGAIARRVSAWLPWLVFLCLGIVSILNALQTNWGIAIGPAQGLVDQANTFAAVFMGIFIEAVPYLLLGTLASGLVEEFVRKEDIARLVPAGSHLTPLIGSLLGLFFPVCECGTVPLTRRLMQKGLPVSVSVAFLLAAPVINPIVIASTLAAFGPGPVFWLRIVLTFFIASFIGVLFSFETNPVELVRANDPPAASDLGPLPAPILAESLLVEQKSFAQRIKNVLVDAGDEFVEMGRYLVAGAGLASLMQTFISQGALLELGKGPILSVVVMAILAALLSICSTVDAFIALAFSGTFSVGAISAFLIFGPMVDIKSIMMYSQVFKRRTVVLLVVLPFLLSVISGVLINLIGGLG